MGKFDGVFLASDFDDTLADRNKNIPPRTLEAIGYFMAEGGRFTIASGRSVESLRQQLPKVKVNAPLIAANGTQILSPDGQELLYQAKMRPGARDYFADLLERWPELGMEVYADGAIWCCRTNFVTEAHGRITGVFAPERPIGDLPDDFVYVKLMDRNENLQEIQRDMLAHDADRFSPIFSVPLLLEVPPAGDGKGNAVLRVAEQLGISPEHVYTAGDQENDLSMLKAAKTCFVPAGSSETALANADVVVCSCDEGAIADAIAWLDERY